MTPTILILFKLIDLAIIGGTAAIRAKTMRDKLQGQINRGGPTTAEIEELELESDALLELLAEQASRQPPRPDA